MLSACSPFRFATGKYSLEKFLKPLWVTAACGSPSCLPRFASPACSAARLCQSLPFAGSFCFVCALTWDFL